MLAGLVLLGALLVAAGVRVVEELIGPGQQSAQGSRTEEARAWSSRITPIVSSLHGPYRADAALHRRLAHQGNSGALRTQAARERARFSHALAELGKVPTPPIRALRRSTGGLHRALALYARGYAEIDRALAGKGRRPLHEGVADTHHARRLLEHWSARLNALGPLFYGGG